MTDDESTGEVRFWKAIFYQKLVKKLTQLKNKRPKFFTVGESTLVNGRGDWKSRLIWLDFCVCCGGGGTGGGGVGDSWLIRSVDTFGGSEA